MLSLVQWVDYHVENIDDFHLMIDCHHVRAVSVAGPEIRTVTYEAKFASVCGLIKVLQDFVEGAVPLPELFHQGIFSLHITECIDSGFCDSILVCRVHLVVGARTNIPVHKYRIFQSAVWLHPVDVLVVLSEILQGHLDYVAMDMVGHTLNESFISLALDN
jgi:hypothetical protein